MESMKAVVLNRRRFLKHTCFIAGGALSSGMLLDACGFGLPGSNAASNGPTTLTVMYNPGELTPAYIKEFEHANSGVTIKFLNEDWNRFNAMVIAKQPPDFMRGSGFYSLPGVALRGEAVDLDPYIKQSKVMSNDDLLPINDMWRFDGKIPGQGPRYGFVKDYSQDGMLWYNKKLFDSAKVSYPSEMNPMSLDELLALGKKLAVRQGGKLQIYGLDAAWGDAGHLMQFIEQQDASLFNSDYTQVDFTQPQIRKLLQWYVDYANARIGPSPLDPSPTGIDIFQANRLALSSNGFWYSGIIAGDTNGLGNHVGLIPAPQAGSHRISACFSGTGAWLPAHAKNTDIAWKLLEYFMTGTPARDRAKSGWGLPPIKTFQNLIPQDKPYQKQVYQTQMAELKYFKVLRFSPYIDAGALGTTIDTTLQDVLKGHITVDQAAQQINAKVNPLMTQNKQQAEQ